MAHLRLGPSPALLDAHQCTTPRTAVANWSCRARVASSNIVTTGASCRSHCLSRPTAYARRWSRLTAKSEDAVDEGEDLPLEEFEDGPGDGRGLTTEQMGSFQLHVRRRIDATAATSPQAASAAPSNPVLGSTTNFDMPPEELEKFKKAHSLNGGSTGGSAEEDEEDEDYPESLVYVNSPKVGVLRRGKYFKGKRVGKGNAVNEGDKVKKGQIVAYIEQLGTYVPVEAPQAGEAVEFLIAEGDPVEFREQVVSLAPFFGGHIIGDAKYS